MTLTLPAGNSPIGAPAVKPSRRNIRNAAARAEKMAQGPRLSSYAKKEAQWRTQGDTAPTTKEAHMTK